MSQPMTDQRELLERLDERARHVTSDADAQTFKEAAALIRSMEERIGKLEGAMRLALEYWAHRQQRYKNRHPVWVQQARAAITEKKEG